MNTKILSLGIIELFLALTVGIVILWLTYELLKKIVAPKMEIKPDNTAFAIFCGAILLSVGLIVSESITPAMNAYRVEVQQSASIQLSVLNFLRILGLYLLIGLLVAALINFISIWLYNFLTKDVDELTEIRNGNIAAAIITAVIILVITLLAKNSLAIIFESLIQYPTTPRFY
jgi:hypothetical protein